MEISQSHTSGSSCSKEGKKYELQIYNIVRKCKIINPNSNPKDCDSENKLFNTQSQDELGGCNSHNDIECNYHSEKDVPIEIKKMNTPDWMQCSLLYDTVENKWKGSLKNKIPNESKAIFENLIENINIFNGKIPPFMLRNITHDEWLQIKKDTKDFNDHYLDCPNDTIRDLYSKKGCKYIQISEKGLYHLGVDTCNFNVPEFICEQKIRIRTKIHTRKNSKGYCSLSVTLSCLPKNIKLLEKSPYSLEDIVRLPHNLLYTC
jgi:hypothetical protein